MSTTSESRSVIAGYMTAIQQRDLAAIRDSFAADATWWLRGELPISGTWRGRDAIVDDFLGTAMSYYDPESVSVEVTSMIAEGDAVVAEWTSRARTAGGKPYENHCAAVFRVRDGRIQSVREYMDTLYASDVAFGRAGSRT
jgi:ketosteroid isomerase-like protein